ACRHHCAPGAGFVPRSAAIANRCRRSTKRPRRTTIRARRPKMDPRRSRFPVPSMLLAALACGCGARDLPPPAASLDAELALIQERLDALEQSVLRASPRQATGDVAPDAERPAARVAEPERELIDAA